MPKYNQPRKTWSYSPEFKAKAVELSLREDLQVKQVAEGLDIHPFMLSRWRKEYREGKIVSSKCKKIDVGHRLSGAELTELEKLNNHWDRHHLTARTPVVIATPACRVYGLGQGQALGHTYFSSDRRRKRRI